MINQYLQIFTTYKFYFLPNLKLNLKLNYIATKYTSTFKENVNHS